MALTTGGSLMGTYHAYCSIMLYDIHVHIVLESRPERIFFSAIYDFPGLMKLQIWMAFMLYMRLLEILHVKYSLRSRQASSNHACTHVFLPRQLLAAVATGRHFSACQLGMLLTLWNCSVIFHLLYGGCDQRTM